MKNKLLALLFAFAVARTAGGALVLTDSFTYPNGNLVGAAGSPWTAHSAGGSTPIQVTNNQIQLVHGSGSREDINALLTGGPFTTGGGITLYSSFKVTFTALPNARSLPGITPGATTNGDYFAHFKDTNTGAATGFGARVLVTTNGTASSNQFRLGIANGAAITNLSGQLNLLATSLSLSNAYKVVTRFVPATGVATIWLNPAAESDPSVTADDPDTTISGTPRPNPLDVVSYAFRQGSGGGTFVIDDLKVGTAFNDVAGPDGPPTISPIAAQSIPANGNTGPIPFIINDDNTAATALALGKNSSVTSLVPLSGITFGGASSNRNVTVTPTANQQGTAIISVTCTDGTGNTTTNQFAVTVGAPSMSAIADQVTLQDTPITIPFTVSDNESAPGTLTVQGFSSNPTLVMDGNIVFAGTNGNKIVTITPEMGEVGVTTISITVSDGINTITNSFGLNVPAYIGPLASFKFDVDGALTDSGQWFRTPNSSTNPNPEVVALGGRVFLAQTNTEDVNTVIGGPFTSVSGAILYASFQVNFSALPGFSGDYFAHFSDDTTGFRARVFALTNGAAPGMFRLGIANNGATVPLAGVYPANLALSNTYNVVFSYNVGTAKARLWINPAKESDFSVVGVDTVSFLDITRFGLRQSTGMGLLSVDNLRVGGSFADVAPYIPLVPSVKGSVVTLTWPAANANVIAQGAPTIAPLNWTNLPAPTVISNLNTIKITNGAANAHYRLIAP